MKPRLDVSTDVLTLEDMPALLARMGVIGPADAFDGRTRILDLTSRNQAFKIVRAHDGLFVKMPRAQTDRRIMDVEARLLREVAKVAPTARAARYFPAWRAEYADPPALVMEALDPVTTLSKVFLNAGQTDFAPQVITYVARMLAETHALAAAPGAPDLSFLARDVPYVWRREIHHGLGGLETTWPTARALIEGFWAHERSAAVARRAFDSWGGDDLVHNDLRFDNVLLTTAPGARFRLVDWELAILGRGEWDVACFVADLVRQLGRFAQPLRNHAKVQSSLIWSVDHGAPVALPFDATLLRDAAALFWTSYVRRRAWGRARREEALARVADMLPFALLRVALEASRGSDTLTAGARIAAHYVTRALDDARASLSADFGVSAVHTEVIA